ncbi:MFS transporter [Hoeflea sp. TYP-13]|uniref:MFS transporter n=1 Tax=Hoeflea sp. TYP-13 TaxID=3230023 RepID=UPI0034C68A5A
MSDDSRNTRLRVVAAGFIGNVLEWYDFAVYGFFAATVGALFFPSEDHTASLIAAFGAFALGFVMRPLGAILFGHIGDRFGRRRLMICSSLAMALSTFAIGILPTYAAIGPAAAVLIIVLRMIQGLSVGGEYLGSGVFLAETAPPRRRGFISSFATAGLFAGLLLGSSVGALVSHVLTADQVAAWGWRLPFLAGLLLGGVVLVLRFGVAEAPLPEKRLRAPLIEAVTRHGRDITLAAATIMAMGASWYVAVIYLPTWMVRHLGFTRAYTLEINAANMAIAAIAGLALAALSDRIGRKPVLLTSMAGLAVFTYPMLWLISQGDPKVVAAAQCVLVIFSGSCAFVLPATFAEMFPWAVRTTSTNLSLNLTFAIFGGTAPVVATWLVARTGDLAALAIYLSVLGILSTIACLFLKERRGIEL